MKTYRIIVSLDVDATDEEEAAKAAEECVAGDCVVESIRLILDWED